MAYAEAVANASSDLPPHVAAELLDGLHEHLTEIRAEGDLRELLGPPSSTRQIATSRCRPERDIPPKDRPAMSANQVIRG